MVTPNLKTVTLISCEKDLQESTQSFPEIGALRDSQNDSLLVMFDRRLAKIVE